jgi:predicted O-linked N-acetylglucosamine transferase (SPINDLY family)
MRPSRDHQLSTRFATAISLHKRGHLSEAAKLYGAVLKTDPNHSGALHHLGVVRGQQGQYDAAVELMQRALSKSSPSAEHLSDLGVALEGAKKPLDAVACYERALVLKPDYGQASFNLGNALQTLGRHDEAIRQFERVIASDSAHAEAYNAIGISLHALERHKEAVAHFRRALALKPHFADAESNLATGLHALGRRSEAAQHFARLLALSPDHAKGLNNLGNLLHELGRNEDALTQLTRALALDANNTDIHNNLGNVLAGLKRYDAAIPHYRRALDLDPLHGNALSNYVALKHRISDWTDFTEDCSRLAEAIGSDTRLVSPFVLTTVTDDPALQLRCARKYVHDLRLNGVPPISDGGPRGHHKIRLAYVSGDLREHAVASLIAELIERHDRTRFDVVAISWSADDGSDMHRRLRRSFDQFVDVAQDSDADVARRINALEIDLAVDLMGFTRDCRPGVFAHRPAPIQINYLGFPATMGASFIDYAIVDAHVVPPDQKPHFAEHLVYLPGCYQVNDGKRVIGEPTPSRAECGLPRDAFVFACFNNTHKISPRIFDVWMRLLRQVPGAVLWLLGDNVWASANLRREAAARNIAPDRVIFAPRCPSAEHMARHRLADLFLDTLPYNAHVTASDALWAGLPVLTCMGRSFSSRVAGSLLHAVGLPELVTETLEEYEALALRLAGNAQLLGALRARLAQQRLTAPLFDAIRYCRQLESAYELMWARFQRGEGPCSFAVAADPAR